MRFALFLILQTILVSSPKDSSGISVSFARYRGNAQAALSLSYDDGCPDQYKLVAPRMDSLGLRGTFYLIGKGLGQSGLSWEQIRELDRRGHEIGNHCWSHTDLRTLPDDSVRTEILRTAELIKAELGHAPISLAPPFNSYDERILSIAAESNIAVRTRQKGLGQGRRFAQGQRYTDFDAMRKWLDAIIAQGDWGITMVHGIYEGWDRWEHPEDFWAFLRYCAQKADADDATPLLWVAPLAEVAAYRREAESCTLELRRRGRTLYITPHCPLDSSKYQIPLTLIITSASGSRQIELDPHGGRIKIRIL